MSTFIVIVPEKSAAPISTSAKRNSNDLIDWNSEIQHQTTRDKSPKYLVNLQRVKYLKH